MRVDLDNVGHRYADGPLLVHDLTASLMPGHVYALTGPSGAGKSTLLGIIAGWTTPAEGQVTRQGIDSMRWIFQNPHGVAQRTAIDHVSLPIDMTAARLLIDTTDRTAITLNAIQTTITTNTAYLLATTITALHIKERHLFTYFKER